MELLPLVNCAYAIVLQEGIQCNIRAPPTIVLRALSWLPKTTYQHIRKVYLVFKRRNDQNALIAIVKVIPPSSVTIFTDFLLPVIRLTLALHLAWTLVLNPFLTKFPLPSIPLYLIDSNNRFSILNKVTPQQSRCVFCLIWSL